MFAPAASSVVDSYTIIIRFSFTIRISGEYLNLNNGLTAIYRLAVMTLYHHSIDLTRLYAKYQKGGLHPDFSEIMRLEQELSEAVGELP